jgi:DNA replication ATP-dependent helicase Dna2
MPDATVASDFITNLERTVRAEKSHALQRLESLWAKPLNERILSCRAIGPLTITGRQKSGNSHYIHFAPSTSDTAIFREGDILRLSQDDPAKNFIKATFHGLSPSGLTVSIEDAPPEKNDGWSLDEDFIDLSPYYLSGIDALKTNDLVLSVLTHSQITEEFDPQAHEEITESLASEFNDSQCDAIATAIASSPIHLIQGPPGTGKTHVLAKTIQELVKSNHRILVTAFTHRAIHHALRKISKLVNCPVFKISDVIPHDSDGINFKPNFAETGLIDHPGPYIIGCTPIPLFTSRANSAYFDIALIDETSQMRVEAAILPMLRANRWIFYGDQQQLPPVVSRPGTDPKDDSIFATLVKQKRNTTLLRETYRLNDHLTIWPSENFYHGELESAPAVASHRFTTKTPSNNPFLRSEPSFLRLEIEHHDRKAVSNEETDAVIHLIEDCLKSGVPPQEIGVVVPFRAQAANIRRNLLFDRFQKHPNISDIAIDTVERFQGQEREIMLISLTVSDHDFISILADFLTNPQRLNVAVTRARTKTILIHSKALRHWLEAQAPINENAALTLSLLLHAEIPETPWPS